MNVLIRDVPDTVSERIRAVAQAEGVSQQELLSALLSATYGAPPLVVGWVRLERRGELEDSAACPECGQPLTEAWAGLLSNGTWRAPCCGWCAVSE
jgi:hypothetical protein